MFLAFSKEETSTTWFSLRVIYNHSPTISLGCLMGIHYSPNPRSMNRGNIHLLLNNICLFALILIVEQFIDRLRLELVPTREIIKESKSIGSNLGKLSYKIILPSSPSLSRKPKPPAPLLPSLPFPLFAPPITALLHQVSLDVDEYIQSAFSNSGRVIDVHRSCLTHKAVKAMICTQNWMRQTTSIDGDDANEEVGVREDLEYEDELEDKDFIFICLCCVDSQLMKMGANSPDSGDGMGKISLESEKKGVSLIQN
ncbi:hypothetical protein OSB04_010926 [Centaurea solstitialis]|uniref:HAT C-terminal dimerisation domain-containing protein n=1 Tax=Centaurea solstitialis TaxID=347529 RepID=A0AA38WCF4_9ASTR|nr:hypothetical protein OSB04_010926 [Centaurea solstitialis]